MATVEIDEQLLKEAMTITKSDNARELIEAELRNLVKRRDAQLRIRELRGKIDWEGDLDAMRRGR